MHLVNIKRKRPLSKSKSRWKGNIKIDLTENLHEGGGVTEILLFPVSKVLRVNLINYETLYRCTVNYGIYILFTHQQMHILLNCKSLT